MVVLPTVSGRAEYKAQCGTLVVEKARGMWILCLRMKTKEDSHPIIDHVNGYYDHLMGVYFPSESTTLVNRIDAILREKPQDARRHIIFETIPKSGRYSLSYQITNLYETYEIKDKLSGRAITIAYNDYDNMLNGEHVLWSEVEGEMIDFFGK